MNRSHARSHAAAFLTVSHRVFGEMLRGQIHSRAGRRNPEWIQGFHLARLRRRLCGLLDHGQPLRYG